MTITDRSPYDLVNIKNDCNGNGVFTDPGDDTDCNNNTTPDVTVKLTSDAEVAGEIAVLDQVSYCSILTTKQCSASIPCTGGQGTCTASPLYKGNFPYSTLYNSPGSLFVVQSGTSLPVITVTYNDRNDGTGSPCSNALEPSVRGQIQTTATVAASTGAVSLLSYSVVLSPVCSLLTTKPCSSNADCTAGQGTCTATSPGDNDGFADANELINLAIKVVNKSGLDVEDLSASLGTTSPNVSCITRSSIVIGSLRNGIESDPATYLPFQFKIANVARNPAFACSGGPTPGATCVTSATCGAGGVCLQVGIADTLQAKFTVTLRSNRFDALTRATDITLDLDLSATGGGAVGNPMDEDFESGFGHYTLEFLDAAKQTLAGSNGYRCQYNDPAALNSNSASNKDCFLGFASEPSTGVNDWHIHDTTTTNGSSKGRAYLGTHSLHLGVHSLDLNTPSRDTTTLKHIMSIRSKPGPNDFINLPLASSNAELNFAQQVSFVDASAGVNVTPGESVQQGVVEIKPSTPANASWLKIYPYSNVYDQQGTDDFSNCMFDPVDDGNNEDSYFDPTDPARRLGPSSTCFPEFTFVHQGQTDYRKTFDIADIGNASDGPGLQGCAGSGCLPANTASTINNPGTWVRTRFSMVPYAGRQISVRFLYTSIEVGGTRYMDGFFGRPNVSGDDGWYIDDIRWTSGPNGPNPLLTSPITLSVDTSDITATALPCGSCSAITPGLAAVPSSLATPGQVVTVTAKSSSVDRCLNGVLQYQFWNNLNGNATVGDLGDSMLRDWTDNSTFVDAPLTSTAYGVLVRCSTDPSCDTASNSALLTVPVTCPTSTAGLGTLKVSKPDLAGAEPDSRATISWGGALTVQLVRGDLTSLRSTGGTTNVDTGGCLANNVFLASVDDNSVVGSGASYYLIKTPSFCNVALSGTYAENLSDEIAGSGGNRDSDIANDPTSCP